MRIFFIILWLSSSILCFGQNPVNEMYKGESDGPHSDLHINGKVRCKYTIKNGNIVDNRTCYYNNGNLWVVEEFNNGVFDGTNYLLNKKQDTVYIEKYKMDTLIYSKNFTYYRNKTIKSITEVWYYNDSTLTENPFKIRKKINGVKINLIETETTMNNKKVISYFNKNGELELIEEYVHTL